MNILPVAADVRFLTRTISADRKNWTYTLRPNQMDVPNMYSEGLSQHLVSITPSMMNEYLRRMSSTGLNAYIRSSILSYDTFDSMLSDDVAKIEVHSQYLPGFSSFQRSIDRYLINQTQIVNLSARTVRNRVYSSFSLKSKVGDVGVMNDSTALC